VGGDLDRTRHVVTMHVDRAYDGERPGDDLRRFAGGLGIHEPFVGLMTAAWTREAMVLTESADGIHVLAAVTVGLGGAAAAGISPPAPRLASTINIVAILAGRLDRAAAVNAVVTATEAKAGALLAAGVRAPEGTPATGTVTDAVVIAWTGQGPALPYLGPGTVPGWLLARAVRRAVQAGIARAGRPARAGAWRG
jgi:adenosylcobinamide amidohydrolase